MAEEGAVAEEEDAEKSVYLHVGRHDGSCVWANER